MKRFAAVSVLAVLVAACEARSPLAPGGSQGTGTFTVTGRVTSLDGAPIEGARVEAIGQTSCPENAYPYPGSGYEPEPTPCMTDQMWGSDDTDASGEFAIANLPSGYVRINVTKDGAVASEGVQVREGSTVTVVLPENPAAVARRTSSRARAH